MAQFFIDRPIFAWVLAIVVMLVGTLSIFSLPISQYPAIAPPAISVTARYPGANAQTLESTVTQPIEQQMKGLDNLEYLSSTSDSQGNVTITLTFAQGTNPDIAQVQTQNKLQLATPVLPQEVVQQGIVVAKSTRNFLLILSLYDTDGTHQTADLGDMIVSRLQDPLSRVTGVGDTQVFGGQYAMRIWLDPNKLQTYSLTTIDVKNAIAAQNAQVSAGQIGDAPSPKGQQLNAIVTAQTRLQTPEQFRQVILKTNTDGSVVRMADVGRVEMGQDSYGFVARFNGHPAAGFAIKLAPGANALKTVNAVKAEMKTLGEALPPGVSYSFPVDTTPFVKLSIEDVVKTLIEAVVLVFIVMFVFLQNWRSTLIPTIAVPVVLLGVFGILAAAGFTINTLTLFALVLAIGLLVDDAIVVVENVERIMEEEGLSPKEATKKSMGEITGALIGIVLVLVAVFAPMAFFGGSTGVIYRQFSITIISAMGLSILTALILTPALCATLLKSAQPKSKRGFFGWFNRHFDESARSYRGFVKRMIGGWIPTALVYAAIVAVMVFLFVRLPSGFLPDEDQGSLYTLVQLPPGATFERTTAVLKQVQDHYMIDEKDTVAGIFTVAGFSFAGSGQNSGIAFIQLKDWDERKKKTAKLPAITQRAGMALHGIRDAMVFPVPPPPVQELGQATGFDFELKDNANQGHDALNAAKGQLLGMASQDPRLTGVRPNGLPDVPQLKVDIDQSKATALGLSLGDVNDTLATALGSAYVNDFIDRGRVKRVYVQGDAPYRAAPDDIGRWFVRGASGTMAPFSAFSSTSWTYGAAKLERYNGIPSAEIQGQPAPGVSSGAAMQVMEQLAAKLPKGFGFEWTGLSYEERKAGAQAPALYAFSILVVFLCLAALYESWSIPVAVLLVLPLGIVGALLAATMRGFTNDVYFQVGLLTTMGLAAKNAILIVEFAVDAEKKGKSLTDAALEAAQLRLRPILMTSLAFIAGVFPLAISSGAGSGSQNDIGTGVIGGMLTATIFGVLFVPVFFVVIRGFLGGKRDKPRRRGRRGGPAAEGA